LRRRVASRQIAQKTLKLQVLASASHNGHKKKKNYIPYVCNSLVCMGEDGEVEVSK
jgi:hypothetical protein